MAAIICKGFREIGPAVCKVVTSPFRLLCANPFSIFVIVALGFNVPPIAIVTFHFINGAFDDCQDTTLILIHIAFCAINILAAIYIACKFYYGGDSETEQRTGYARARYILCHDPVVAIYILIFLGFFVWLCIGARKKLNNEFDDNCMSMNSGENYSWTALGLGFAYITEGFLALKISMCCSHCKSGRRREQEPQQQKSDQSWLPMFNFSSQQQQQKSDKKSWLPLFNFSSK